MVDVVCRFSETESSSISDRLKPGCAAPTLFKLSSQWFRMLVFLTPVLTSCSSVFSLAGDMEQITVYRDDTLYYITPWLLQLQNGDLILTAREAHARSKEQRGHVDPTARGILLRSRDNGRTWGEKVVVDDETYRFSQTEDVPVVQLSDGTLLLNLYSWAISPFPVGFPTDGGRPYAYTFEGEWILRSPDMGKTWSSRQRLMVPGLPRLAARTPALELPDHTLLLAVYGNPSPGQDYRNASPEQPYHSWVIRSNDMGRTWGSPSVLAADPEKKTPFAEPCLLRTRRGELIAMMRTEGYLYQSNSSDDGRTWSQPIKTVMWGFPAHLLELRDGRILCTYGYRRKPYGVRGCISRDGGKSWDIQNEIILRADGGTHDLGYPSSVQFPDGRVLTTYWFNQQKEGDPTSETRFLAGTFYRP